MPATLLPLFNHHNLVPSCSIQHCMWVSIFQSHIAVGLARRSTKEPPEALPRGTYIHPTPRVPVVHLGTDPPNQSGSKKAGSEVLKIEVFQNWEKHTRTIQWVSKGPHTT